MPLDLVPGDPAQSHAVIHGNIIADFSGFTDDHSHTVINEELAADPGAGMNLDAGDEAGDLRSKSAEKEHVMRPEPVGDAMQPDGMQPRIAEEDFKCIACRRIAIKTESISSFMRANIVSHLLTSYRLYFMANIPYQFSQVNSHKRKAPLARLSLLSDL